MNIKNALFILVITTISVNLTYTSEELKPLDKSQQISQPNILKPSKYEQNSLLIDSLKFLSSTIKGMDQLIIDHANYEKPTYSFKCNQPDTIEHQPNNQTNLPRTLSGTIKIIDVLTYGEKPIHSPTLHILNDLVENNIHSFDHKRIYFNNSYDPIKVHAKNPAFNDVKLVIFQGNSRFGKLFFKPFKTIGTYSNKNQHEKLKYNITQYGGLWCPRENAIIGGTRDKNMCEAFHDFEKQYTTRS